MSTDLHAHTRTHTHTLAHALTNCTIKFNQPTPMQRTTAAQSRSPQHFIRTHSLSPSLPLALTHDVPVNLIGGHLCIVRAHRSNQVYNSSSQKHTDTNTRTHTLSLSFAFSLSLSHDVTVNLIGVHLCILTQRFSPDFHSLAPKNCTYTPYLSFFLPMSLSLSVSITLTCRTSQSDRRTPVNCRTAVQSRYIYTHIYTYIYKYIYICIYIHIYMRSVTFSTALHKRTHANTLSLSFLSLSFDHSHMTHQSIWLAYTCTS